jgi:hypothetical protein
MRLNYEELSRNWSIMHDEHALLKNRTPQNRLGVAVFLKYYQNTGRFPSSKQEVDEEVVAFISGQLRLYANEWNKFA